MKVTLRNKLYDAIIYKIIRGEINNETVLNENKLADEFNVSKAPVREALIQLTSEDILVSIPRCGYMTKATNQNFLQDVVEHRLIIEPAYLDKYFFYFNQETIKSLEKYLKPFDSIIDDPITYWENTSKFHLGLAICYKNEYFFNMLQSILKRQLITFATLYWQQWNNLQATRIKDLHSLIYKAIQDQDKDLAIELLKKDIQSFIEGI